MLLPAQNVSLGNHEIPDVLSQTIYDAEDTRAKATQDWVP
jgi:hypothetical protein